MIDRILESAPAPAPTLQGTVSLAPFSDDGGAYNQKDADGFIKLNALRLKLGAKRR